MSYLLDPFVLLFFTAIIGNLTAKIRIRGAALGSAMLLLCGLAVSCLVGVYTDSLPEGHALYASARQLMDQSIVPANLQNLFMAFFMSSVGLMASRELIPVLKKYGLRFVGLAIIITTLGAAGTFLVGNLSKQYTPYEMSGVFSGALSSTPGMTAGLSSAATRAGEEIDAYPTLSEQQQRYIVSIVGEPAEGGAFSLHQKDDYQKNAQTVTGIGYTVTFPFGNLLVLFMINALPAMFRFDLKREKEQYEAEMSRVMQGNAAKPGKEKPSVYFDVIAFFVVLLLGDLLGKIKIGSFSLSTTGGVLIVSLILGSIHTIGKLNFRFDSKVLKVLQSLGISGVLSAIGLRLGYSVLQAITGMQFLLVIYAFLIGVMAMFLGYLIGRYIFKLNWMILSGVLCGAMTNTSGLGIAVDATKSDYPSIGYAATYPFAVVMMVVYTVLLQGLQY